MPQVDLALTITLCPVSGPNEPKVWCRHSLKHCRGSVLEIRSSTRVRSASARIKPLCLPMHPTVCVVGTFPSVEADLCQRAHGSGVRVWAWGDEVVKEDPALIEMGVDGFIVNNPRLEPDVASHK